MHVSRNEEEEEVCEISLILGGGKHNEVSIRLDLIS